MPSSRTHPSVSPTHPKSSPEQAEYLYRTHKIALDPTPERLLTHTATMPAPPTTRPCVATMMERRRHTNQP